MPTPCIALSRFNVPPQHLFRHLLREASYLPPVCAAYVSARVKEQFRKHQHQPQHVATRMAAGRRKLRHLQAANAGNAKRLHDVFLHTFGRTGPLRRTLIASLVRPDPPATSDDLQAPTPKPKQGRASKIQAIYEKARSDTKLNKAFIDMWDFDKLQDFAQSQISHAKGIPAPVWPRGLPVKSNPLSQIDAKNAWGHDLPLRELRARLKRWWRKLAIDRIEPPLGAGEWETLRDLATKLEMGQLLRAPHRRRPVAVPVHEGWPNTRGKWKWQAYASLPTVQIEKERDAGIRESVDGFEYEPVPSAGMRPTNRKLRRAARKVFQASAYIERDGTTGKSKAIWGTLTPDFHVVDPEGSYFFEGLDDSGSMLSRDPAVSPADERRRKPRQLARQGQRSLEA